MPFPRVTRRHFLQATATLSAGALLADRAVAAPSTPRSTAFLQWVATQTQKPSRFQFAVMGDNRPNTKRFDQLIARVNQVQPAFLVHLGDICDNGTAEQWRLVSPSFDALARPVIATLGNHDRYLKGPKNLDLEYWATQFGPREWAFKVGGWHFVSIDTSLGRVTDTQAAWLDTVLNDNMPTMLFTHYPPSVGAWKVHSLYSGTEQLMALLKKHTVEHFFCGHIHLYDKQQWAPTTAVCTGGAGSSLYTQWGFGVHKHHFTRVGVEGGRTEIEVVPLA